jgi:hypothetical protein
MTYPVYMSTDADEFIVGRASTERGAVRVLRRAFKGIDINLTGARLADREVSAPDGYYTGSGRRYDIKPCWVPSFCQ